MFIKYAAAAGVRRLSASSDPRKDPFIIIIGPSGQCATVPAPSGLAGSTQGTNPAADLNAYHHTMDHAALAWTSNEIVTSLRKDQGTVRQDWGYAFQPYGQVGPKKKNDAVYNFEQNVSMSNDLMFDGAFWKVILPSVRTAKHSWSFKRLAGGSVFWTAAATIDQEENQNYGAYDGKDPVRTGDAGGTSAPSGWRPLSGMVGKQPFDVISSAHWDRGQGGSVHPGGVLMVPGNVSSVSTNVNDILQDSRGNIYVAFQHGLFALRFGGKGQWVWSENLFSDQDVNNYTPTLTYVSRLQQNSKGAGVPKCLAEHNGEVFMLTNTGKVFVVKPDTVEQVADLTTLGTPWSEGVFGGAQPREPQPIDGAYDGTDVRRPFVVSFNDQLHAFLNFKSDEAMAKGVKKGAENIGRGVFWATSFDGRNWTDQSPNLPASGIVSPSGGDVTSGQPPASVTAWLSFISPYRFSGFTGSKAEPIPMPSGDFPAGYGAAGIGGFNLASGVKPAQPSGLIQRHVPVWTSGNMVDAPGTPFDQLTIPLERNAVSGFLFPTFIRYPKRFSYQHPVSGGPFPANQGGIFMPSGVGPSGWDYTGCENYHISGYVDERAGKLQLYFTRDHVEGGTLFFELSESSGWVRRNFLQHSKQLNGYVPVMLYNPEITIPSGSVVAPNPVIDEVNKEARLRFRLRDWPFWDAVDVVAEYSIDHGASWRKITTMRNLSTGSKQTDPSGVKGVEHVLSWHWSDDGMPNFLSKNEWYPHVQVKLTAVDPNFAPEGNFP